MARSIELSLRLLDAISSERQARMDASHQATHDALTGLPNRTLILNILERKLATHRNQPDGLAIFFIDIDRFKWVNDAHGHATGDALLIEVSRRLQNNLRPGDVAGRLSGDEFIIITADSNDADAGRLATEIIDSIRQPIRTSGVELNHSASIGITFANDHDSASTLIENADMAMYRAKASGRGRYAFFAPGMREEAQQRLLLEETLRQALIQGEIRPHLQPIVRLDNRELVGFEALARWHHPQLGVLTPATFIQAAEENGLIEDIDLQILNQASKALGIWKPLSQNLRLSANLSARTIASTGLTERVDEILTTSGMEAKDLLLEITETSLIQDIEASQQTFRGLQQLGLRLAIDDFGTGYSSLMYLKRFPVGILKIDRSFVADLAQDPEDRVIAEAIVSLAQALGVEVVAEGVETKQQEDLLRAMGCTYGQGYRYGRPQPLSDVYEQLKRCSHPQRVEH
jgi:diguanylate cyclase (GGDEF)-like protein